MHGTRLLIVVKDYWGFSSSTVAAALVAVATRATTTTVAGGASFLATAYSIFTYLLIILVQNSGCEEYWMKS